MSLVGTIKFCVRCEDQIPVGQECYFRAVQEKVGEPLRMIEYFCPPCFKIDSPEDAADLSD